MPSQSAYSVCVSVSRSQHSSIVRYRKGVSLLSRLRSKGNAILFGLKLVALIVSVRILVIKTVRSIKHGNCGFNEHTGTQRRIR